MFILTNTDNILGQDQATSGKTILPQVYLLASLTWHQ